MHKKRICLFFIIFIFFTPFVTQIKASDLTNEYGDSNIIIEDDANLLTKQEKLQLKQKMAVLSEYGIVMFKTTNTTNKYTSLEYIQNYYYSKFGNKSGVAFYIDMNGRQICACATGGLEKIITSSKCDTIMDNVYKYATKSNYYECARETFSQMNKLLSGMKIEESMKYFCNAFLSVMISLFASYGIFMQISRNKKAQKKELVKECDISLEHSDIIIEKTGTHKVYSPIRDSSSSSGGGSFGGGLRWQWRRLFWKWR